MMIVDHIAVGIILPNTAKKFQNSTAITVSIIASILPDLPVIFSLLKGSIYYLSHRSLTHSFVMAPLFSIIPVLLAFLFFRKHLKNNIIELYLLSIISFNMHIFFDLITPYGTQILYPLSNRKFSLDLLHAFDPIFIVISTSIIVFFLVRVKSGKCFNTFAIVVFLGVYLLYGGFTLTRKFISSENFNHYVHTKLTNTKYLRTIPRTFWRWKGIAKNPVKFIVIVKSRKVILHKAYQIKADIPGSIKRDEYYTKFMDYARFPVIIKEKNVISCINLIYSPGTYRLNFKLDDKDNIIKRELTWFDIADKDI